MPPSSLVKASVRPSGDTRGWWSQAGPRLMAVAVPPAIGSL